MDKQGKLAIIGAGKMGQAIARALLDNNLLGFEELILSSPHVDNLVGFEEVSLTSDNKEASRDARILISAVKPQETKNVLEQIKGSLNKTAIIISIAAGVEIKTIKKILGEGQRVVRVMPNIATLVNESISIWVKSPEVGFQEVEKVKSILGCFGMEVLIEDEKLLDQVTAISGSGPGYIFYFLELFEKAALDLGINEEFAEILIAQTLKGSAKLLEKTGKSFKELRESVTSKAGTTQAALDEFEKGRLPELVSSAVKKAYERSKKLGKMVN